MLGHTRARLASSVVKRTPSDPAMHVDDGVDRGRHVQSIPPVLPIGFNDVAMLPHHVGENDKPEESDSLSAPDELHQATEGLHASNQNVVFDDLQSLLGNGNWAPWFQNSVCSRRLLKPSPSLLFLRLRCSEILNSNKRLWSRCQERWQILGQSFRGVSLSLSSFHLSGGMIDIVCILYTLVLMRT